jgi:dTDP-4-dehydrorhamnose 3,5-epimerase
MRLIATSIPDVLIVEPSIFGDSRGWFMESYNEQQFHRLFTQQGLAAPKPFVQDNHSKSNKGTLRGLHFQTENTQAKLVRVVQGEVFDVAVDLRPSSPTYGNWEGVHLSGENKRQLWVPEGFAHGFYVVSDTAEVLYKTTDYYNPEAEISIAWNDPTLAINWPISGALAVEWPISGILNLSKKDIDGMSFDDFKDVYKCYV